MDKVFLECFSKWGDKLNDKCLILNRQGVVIRWTVMIEGHSVLFIQYVKMDW